MNLTNNFMTTTCLILAAGASERMGKPKALLPFGSEGHSFLDRIVATYNQSGFSEVVVVVNQDLFNMLEMNGFLTPLAVSFLINHFPWKGRFHSFSTGLEAIAADSYVFLQNVDNPFVDTHTLREMYVNRLPEGVVYPVFDGRKGHPVLIGPGIIRDARKYRAENARIDSFLNTYPCRTLDTSNAGILSNINTREEYKKAFGFFPD